jgi:Fe-Mn family superoxide dismutase
MDIRETIDLLESKNKIELVRAKLPYKETDLAPVKSKSTLEYHYGQLYKGYVDRYNNGEGDPDFNEAGAFLHDIYFTQFHKPQALQPTGKILDLILRNHKSYQDFKNKFKEEAMKIQGSGWIYLSKSGTIKTIKNHEIRKDIALLVDWWEHAWALDYQSHKEKYLNNIWKIMDWDAINKKL